MLGAAAAGLRSSGSFLLNVEFEVPLLIIRLDKSFVENDVDSRGRAFRLKRLGCGSELLVTLLPRVRRF